MSHCHDEHESHEHEHSHDGPDRGTEASLYPCIDHENIRCLNESVAGSGKNVIKPWHERNDTTKACINALTIEANVYINREDIDFDTVDSYTATQEWELVSSPDNVEYITRMAKMYNVRNLTLYFPENFGDDVTRIFYIGLKGEWTE
ncbi:29773_t:CDS:2, partial [Racocetra persica]